MVKVKYSLLLEVLRNDPDIYIASCTTKRSIDFLEEHIKTTNNIQFDASDLAAMLALRKKITGFCSTLKRKWVKCSCNLTSFLSMEKIWLKRELDLAEFSNRMIGLLQEQQAVPSTSRGRPAKPFIQLSDRMKRERTKNMRSTAAVEELCYAAASSLYITGKRTACNIVTEATQLSPERPAKMRKMLQQDKENITPYTEDQALALLIDCRLSKSAYMQLRKEAAERGANIYPSYHKMLAAKSRCYPDGIKISEHGASIPLQNLLDHTCRRILETLKFTDKENYFSQFQGAELFCKWGCDGSSGENEYMQLFNPTSSMAEDEQITKEEISEKHVFMFSLVPLRLIGIHRHKDNIIFWENPKPSSVNYCRPIKFLYIKETKQSTQREVSKTAAELEALTPLEFVCNGSSLMVNYKMVLTMLDTKVISAITESAAQCCYICGCKPSQMNNLKLAKSFPVNEENLKYGLSTLHAWIKFLECVLHIAYKLEYRKTTTRGATSEQKSNIQSRKSNIQNALWRELGLKVDRVVQGAGTSNTGNVARRFFENPDKAAEITGVDVNLLTQFWVILQVLSSGHEVNEGEFAEYAANTARLYVSLYNWYSMPPTVHKILVHGGHVISNCFLPIGSLSEEAQEARNKDYRRIRKYHTRKNARINTTTDLMQTLLTSSNPCISSYRKYKVKDVRELHPDAIKLLNIDKNADDTLHQEM